MKTSSHRQARGLQILKDKYDRGFSFLGEGASSVVFHDGTQVFKVFLLENIEGLSYKRDLLSTLESKIDRFKGSVFLYPIKNLIRINPDTFILTYAYEESLPCEGFSLVEMEDFLTDLWQRKIIFQDIKPQNFVRVNGQLKWIDYEPDKYTDNLFLNMATRAFIHARYNEERDKIFINKLCRSAINNFQMSALDGLQDFINHIFARIVFQESTSAFPREIPIPADNCLRLENADAILEKLDTTSSLECVIPFTNPVNPETLFFSALKRDSYLSSMELNAPRLDSDGYISPNTVSFRFKPIRTALPNVSLIIKACVQDADILYVAVKHIIKQTAYPDQFAERILALDVKQHNFLRAYNDSGTWEKTLQEADRLLAEGLIDQVVYPNEEQIKQINHDWLGLNTISTHTTSGIPVTAQLFAFEAAQHDLILQMDCDVLIGRLQNEHSFLQDMIEALKDYPNAISVGFNIFHGSDVVFHSYHGSENGGFVPEVRFCLLDRARMKQLLPLPNEIQDGAFTLSWYRSLEIRQNETHTCSLRGGNTASFFIHPQNFRKTDQDVWMTMQDRVEQLAIPHMQAGRFDMEGSYYDWTVPKRKEPLVVVSCLRNIELPCFLRYWYSLISQSFADWGLVLIDDASENGIACFIKELIKPFASQITFVQNRFRMNVAHNTYKSIHYFIERQDAVVVIVDADDALIGRKALKNVYEKYVAHGADLVIGKMLRTDKLHPHYAYRPDFSNPRLYGGNVWQHMRSFRKYLFDSLTFKDLKFENTTCDNEDQLLARKFHKIWKYPEHCWDYTIMVPMVEMSQNPMMINHFNYLHERSTPHSPEIRAAKDEIISKVLNKPSKSPSDIVSGRIDFHPNFQKIEIDITYACNLKCLNCNRSSTQAPTSESMDLNDIQAFIDESIKEEIRWELINILGGEPTIHPQFLDIVNLILSTYLDAYSPETVLQITSNGYGPKVQEKLSALPDHPQMIIDYASFKDERRVPYFSPFNMAPTDDDTYQDTDFFKGCWVTSYCGIGLNHLGYYPCGVAGGIDRVFRQYHGAQSILELKTKAKAMLSHFCKSCGNFSDYAANQGNFIPRHEKNALTEAKISQTWKKAYKTYNGEK